MTINDALKSQSQYFWGQTSDTDSVFDEIQRQETMAGAMKVFRFHMAKPLPQDKTDWETIWPRICIALIKEHPELEFPDPDAPFGAIRAFLLSQESSPLLASIRDVNLSGLELARFRRFFSGARASRRWIFQAIRS